MTSIITAWLVKLATRILRDKLAALNDDTERLLLRLEARNQCVEYQEAENKKLIAQVTEYEDNNLILGDRVEKLQAAVTLHHRQLAEQSVMLDKVRAERDSYLSAVNAAAGVTGAMRDELEKLRTNNEVLRRQQDNQAATMAAIHTDAEKLWDMLQKGLEKR